MALEEETSAVLQLVRAEKIVLPLALHFEEVPHLLHRFAHVCRCSMSMGSSRGTWQRGRVSDITGLQKELMRISEKPLGSEATFSPQVSPSSPLAKYPSAATLPASTSSPWATTSAAAGSASQQPLPSLLLLEAALSYSTEFSL